MFSLTSQQNKMNTLQNSDEVDQEQPGAPDWKDFEKGLDVKQQSNLHVKEDNVAKRNKQCAYEAGKTYSFDYGENKKAAVTLIIKTLESAYFRISNLGLTVPIRNLKKFIADQLGGDVDQLRMIHNAQPCLDDHFVLKYLSDYPIHLVMNMRGS